MANIDWEKDRRRSLVRRRVGSYLGDKPYEEHGEPDYDPPIQQIDRRTGRKSGIVWKKKKDLSPAAKIKSEIGRAHV